MSLSPPFISHRRPPRPFHSQLTQASIPLPKIPTAVASFTLVTYLSARPLLALYLSHYLRTRLTLSTLRVRPLRRELHLCGVKVYDPRGRHLLSLDALRIALRPFPTPKHEKSHTPLPKRLVHVTLDKPALTAIFDSYDLTTSNWTLFVKNFVSPRRPSTTTPSPPPQQRSHDATPSKTDVRVTVTSGVHLSLRSALLNNARLIPDVTLANVSVAASDIRNPQRVARFVDALAGRAVSAARVRAFPREFRDGARRYARRVLREGVAEGIRVTKRRVGDMRKRIKDVDEYVLRDLPDAEGLGEKVRAVGEALKGIEWLLGGGKGEGEGEANEEEERGAGKSGGVRSDDAGEAGQEGDRNGEAGLAAQYRELDEGDATSGRKD